MNKETLIAGHEIKRAFLGEVIRTGVWKITPDNLSTNQWSMQRKIGFQYGLKDNTTLEELGDQYGMTRERARQLNHAFLDNAYRTASPQLQAQYPRETIPDRKPLGQKSRERQSEAQGGTSLRIRKAVEEQGIAEVGAEDIDNIIRTARVTKQQLLTSRHALGNWGIYIPRVDTPYEDFAEKIRNEEDDKKLQELLESLSTNQLRGFSGWDSSHAILSTVSAIANEEGFHVHTKRVRFIAEKIKTAGIPERYVAISDAKGRLVSSLYVVYAKHAGRIAEALRNDPDLQRFR